MTRMLYKYPSKYKGNTDSKGVVMVEGIKFDYAIVSESSIEESLPRGWYMTAAEAKASKSK